jgi:hypothetical protein
VKGVLLFSSVHRVFSTEMVGATKSFKSRTTPMSCGRVHAIHRPRVGRPRGLLCGCSIARISVVQQYKGFRDWDCDFAGQNLACSMMLNSAERNGKPVVPKPNCCVSPPTAPNYRPSFRALVFGISSDLRAWGHCKSAY